MPKMADVHILNINSHMLSFKDALTNTHTFIDAVKKHIHSFSHS